MARWLASSASPPWWIWGLLVGSMTVALFTAFSLTPVSIPLAVVGLGTAIYATSRFTKPRYRVVQQPARPNVKAALSRPQLVEPTMRQLPSVPYRRVASLVEPDSREPIRVRVVQGKPIRDRH